LRVLGLAQLKQFHRYHRVLSQAKWSGLAISRILLNLLGATFAGDGPLVFGVDETLERRRGAKIAAKGVYHDAVRSSHSHFVKAEKAVASQPALMRRNAGSSCASWASATCTWCPGTPS
jgi:hypothetical protein